MAAYLIVDVDDLLARLQSRAFSIDFHDLATRLRNSAALVAGLANAELLRAIAVARWSSETLAGTPTEQVFEGVGFEIYEITDPQYMADALMIQYFSHDPQPVDELIIVATSVKVLSLISRIRLQQSARVRVWADQAPNIDGVIFQPLESVLGIQSKTVALYVDFENIAISLNEQGYAVNLDKMIEGLSQHAAAHGQIVRMAAYAPWGQRGSLPPLIDAGGREVSDEAPSRLAMSNIDPVFNLPGKNSADMRIAKDVLAESGLAGSADIFIIASGDRDFNEVFGALRGRNKQVIVWGVRGSTSRIVENNPTLQVEYLDDFLHLQRYEAVGQAMTAAAANNTPSGPTLAFTPSQWSSVVFQYDRLAASTPTTSGIPVELLQEQLRRVNAVVSSARGRDLVSQAMAMGILKVTRVNGVEYVEPSPEHIIVERSRLVRERVMARVANTLDVRGWEYVNYGFLLKGIAMDRDLEKPGLNIDDAWRSEWVDCLVREGILIREMVPHRHNPDDLVPVIKLSTDLPMISRPLRPTPNGTAPSYDDLDPAHSGQVLRDMETDAMMKRVIVSVDQFTSYRSFTWCPLGSLHRRLRPFDSGVTFQRAVEWLQELGAVFIEEYENPQSNYKTKGISLNFESAIVNEVLKDRNRFIYALLDLYDQRQAITFATLSRLTEMTDSVLALWISIMEAENVLNPVHGKPGVFSLFRTHHTVNLVANQRPPNT